MVHLPPDIAKEQNYGVPPVARAIAVLRYIAAGNRCRNLSEAAKAIGINRTTLIRILATLDAEDMIEKVPEAGGYRLGTSLIALAAQSLNERGILQVARPFLRQLVQELKLSAHLGVLEGREIIYLARETPNSHLVSMVREGTRLPAHATTIGRILLAQLPLARLRELYRDEPMQAFTGKTSTTLERLEEQIAADRARGVAWSVGFFEPEIGSAAAAVLDHQGRAVGAINVTGPASIFAADNPVAERVEALLKQAARSISEAMGYRGWSADLL